MAGVDSTAEQATCTATGANGTVSFEPLALAGSSMVVERPFQLDPETLGCFGKLILHLVSHRIPHFFGTKKWSKQLEHSPISIHF